MLSDNLLIRNKKLAEYSLELCERIGVSSRWDGEKIYAFLLVFNYAFENIDLKDDIKVKDAFRKLQSYFSTFYKDVDYGFLSVYKKMDYTKKILDVIYLTILHLDKDGNYISIEEKLNEIKGFFGENSLIYNTFLKIASEYIVEETKERNLSLTFMITNVTDFKIDSVSINCKAKINAEYFNKLVSYLVSMGNFKNMSDAKLGFERFCFTYNISYEDLLIDNKEINNYHKDFLNSFGKKIEIKDSDYTFIYNISCDIEEKKALHSLELYLEDNIKQFYILDRKGEVSISQYREIKGNEDILIDFNKKYMGNYSYTYTFSNLIDCFLRDGGMVRLSKRIG